MQEEEEEEEESQGGSFILLFAIGQESVVKKEKEGEREGEREMDEARELEQYCNETSSSSDIQIETPDQQNSFSVHCDVESAVVDVSDKEVLFSGDQQTRTHHLSLWLKKKLKSLYSAVIRSLKDLLMFMR